MMYSDRVTTVQFTTVPAHSLEFAKEKLKTEIKRRIDNCEIMIHSASLQVSEDEKYNIVI
ncbi:hypothetical protein [Bacillus sp. 71mf]|nr:hypothetical protein [Bacillus sp. 71mf]